MNITGVVRVSAACCFVLALGLGPVRAATFYVSNDGQQAGDGSREKPWPSVEFALSKVGAGNTIVVRPGIYRGTWQIRNFPAKPGGPPTIIESEVKWKAVVNGGREEAINVVDCSGIVLDGFEVAGARADGISMNTDRGTVRNCWVHSNGAMGVSSHDHKDVTIEANLIEFNGCNIQFHHGVYASGEGLTVRRNIVRHNSGYGLHLYPSIRGAVVTQNLVFGHVHQAGIIVACPEGGGRNLVVNNTVVGNAAGIAISRGGDERVFNNIIVSPGEVLSLGNGTKDVTADYNLCQPDIVHQGPHSTVADPRFVEPGRGIFWLLLDSPAIGKGATEFAPPSDFWGRPSPQGKPPDLGAFAFDPALVAGKEKIGWYGWPYRFAPQGAMELRDLWSAPSRPDEGERTKTAGNVTLYYAPESEALSADLLMYAVTCNEYLARLFRPAEPVRQRVFWLPARWWRNEPKTYGFPYTSGADAYLAAADVDLPKQLSSIADAMEIERGGPDVTRMAEMLGLSKKARPEGVFRQLKGSKEFFVTLTAGFILPHELTHGFSNVLGYPAMPRWFYEGIAQHVALHAQRERRSPREAELSYAYYQLLWDRAAPRLEVKDFLRADDLGAGGLTTANYAWYHAGLLRMFRDLEAMKGSDLLPDLIREASKLRGRREVSNADMVGVFSAAVGRDLRNWFSANWRIETGAPAGETLHNGIRLPATWPPRLSGFPTSADKDPAEPPYLTSPPEVIPIDVGRQLFVDDFLVAETTLKRTFHLPKYHPASPVLKPDKAWEMDGDPKRGNDVAMVFSDGVWYDPRDKLFKIWYMAGPSASTCYATSEDGVHWVKPVLDVKPGTNILVPGYRDSNTVWLDLEEKDPGRRFKMFRVVGAEKPDPVTEWNNWVMSIHFSADGIHWRQAGTSGRLVDRSTVFWNPFRKVWVYSIRHMYPWSRGTYGAERRRSYEENADVLVGSRWEVGEPLPWIDVDRLDPPREDLKIKPQLYNLDAVAYESLILGFFTIWRGQPADRQKPNDVVLGYSRDGWHWHRPDRRAFCPVSDKQGDWNANNVQSAGGGCLVVGNQLYFYVSGRAGVPGSNQAGVCTTGLATLRRDGFASMDADEGGGTLTTRPVRFSGKRLFVNIEAPAGELRVEVLDEGGRAREPFTRRACVPVRDDRTLQELRWEGAEDLSALAGTTVRFRFHLQKGKLYAFWVSPDASGASRGYVAAGGPGFTGPTDTVGAAALGSH